MDAIVLFGDVIRSRRDAPGSTAWLRALVADLTGAYPLHDRLAPFEFTQGDELQGLLAPTADPLIAVLRAALHPQARPMRWVAVAGPVDAGSGPATQRSGAAFLQARERLVAAAARRERLAIASGDPWTDGLLDRLAPLLGALLADLTPRQREIARPLLLDRRRRSEAAELLGISRATVSVAADRAHLRGIGDLAEALRTLVAAATVSR